MGNPRAGSVKRQWRKERQKRSKRAKEDIRRLGQGEAAVLELG
jgi:hypothetical protein